MMVRKKLFMVFIFLIAGIQVYASGKHDAEIKTQNDEWILCITEFNTSSLPAEKRNVAEVISRELVQRINTINYRTRISPEYTYYEEYAWANERAAAAKSIAVKQDERSQILFRGDPDWRYKQNIKKIDKDIESLRISLEKVENNVPIINKEPEFKLHARNLEYVFPASPNEGAEVKFLNDQKADAFLQCSVSDFHGRFYLSVKLYALFTRTVIWEDSIIFSHNDFNNAVEEISRRLLIMLSGGRPATIAIKTEPAEALVLINRSFAGRGEITMMEYPPGKITVTASAPDYDSITFETETAHGEHINLNIRLNPIEYGEMEIAGKRDGNIYYGALYIGESPMTIRLPANKMEYIEIISEGTKPDGIIPEKIKRKDTSYILQSGAIAFQTPNIPDYYQTVSFRTSAPLGKDRINKERDHYYWVWGTQWITGIAAWIAYYTYMGTDNAIRYDYNSTGNYNEKFYGRYSNLYYIYHGAFIAFGAASAYGIFRMFRYIYRSGKDTPSIAKPAGRK